MFKVVNQYGIPFNVKVVKQGETYGRRGCLVHEHEIPLVEFYDARYVGKFEDWVEGQFVSSYYATTLLDHDGGLLLDGGITDWTVNEDNMVEIKQFVRNSA